MGFLKSLQNYEKDNMDEKRVAKIQQWITHENFSKERLEKVNNVAASLCAWVLAMDKYYNISLIVKPKQASLAEAEASYAILSADLNEKKEALRIV